MACYVAMALAVILWPASEFADATKDCVALQYLGERKTMFSGSENIVVGYVYSYLKERVSEQ